MIDETLLDGEKIQEDIPQAIPMQQGFQLPEWLKAPTGEGSIDSYMEHPMNFNNSKGLAQVLRGLTGMFNNLNYAIIDVVLGALKMSKPKALPNE